MQESDTRDSKHTLERLAGSLLLLSFGCAMLAYLIAIDRAEWFNLRPASGTAAAMSNASQKASDPRMKERAKPRINQYSGQIAHARLDRNENMRNGL